MAVKLLNGPQQIFKKVYIQTKYNLLSPIIASPQAKLLKIVEKYRTKGVNPLEIEKLQTILKNAEITITKEYQATFQKKVLSFRDAESGEMQNLVVPKTAAEVFDTLGVMYLMKNQPNLATAAFLKSVALDPYQPEAHYRLGNCYANELSLYDLAITEYKDSIILNPKFLGAFYRLAFTCFHKRELPRALKGFTKFIKMAGKVLSLHKDAPTEKAIKKLQEAGFIVSKMNPYQETLNFIKDMYYKARYMRIETASRLYTREKNLHKIFQHAKHLLWDETEEFLDDIKADVYSYGTQTDIANFNKIKKIIQKAEERVLTFGRKKDYLAFYEEVKKAFPLDLEQFPYARAMNNLYDFITGAKELLEENV